MPTTPTPNAKTSDSFLLSTRAELAQALDLARLAFWEHDAVAGRFVLNERFYTLHGTSAAAEGGYEMATETYVREFLLPEDKGLFEDGMKEAMNSTESSPVIELEHRIRRRDGAVRHVQVRMAITKGAKGELLLARGITQDITERVEAEETLHRLSRAVEQISEIVVITSPQGNIQYVNQGFACATGYQPEEVIGGNPRLLQSGLHPKAFYTELWDTLRAGEVWRGEFCNRKKNGELYWESATISPIRNRRGEITNYIAIKKDITAKKRALDALQRTQEALAKSEALLRTVTGTIPLGLYVSDCETDEILYFNRHYCKLWGLQDLEDGMRRGLVKHSELFPQLMNTVADGPRFAAHCQPLQSPQSLAAIESEIPLKDGRTLRLYSTPVRDGEQRHVGRLCLVDDVSRRKQAGLELGASLREKEVLLREVYHRVKNNLQVISSLLSLQSGTISDPRTREVIRETQDRVRSMAMVHEKLYRAKDLSRIDFGEYARDLVTMLSHSYRVDGRTVQVRLELQSIALNLDTAIPCSLILNELVSNALKYAFPVGRHSSRASELTVGLRTAEKGFVLTVRDNGVGLPPQIDPTRTSTLGLQVVAMLTEQLKGSIEVRRENGTAFLIAFQEIPDKPKAEPQANK